MKSRNTAHNISDYWLIWSDCRSVVHFRSIIKISDFWSELVALILMWTLIWKAYFFFCDLNGFWEFTFHSHKNEPNSENWKCVYIVILQKINLQQDHSWQIFNHFLLLSKMNKKWSENELWSELGHFFGCELWSEKVHFFGCVNSDLNEITKVVNCQ